MVVKVASTIFLIGSLILSTAPAGAESQRPLEELTAMRSTDPAALLEILDRELGQIEPGGDDVYLTHLFRLRAETLRDRGEYIRAREDAVEFQRRAQSLDDPRLISRALMLQGTIDAEQGNVTSALDRFHEARKLLESGDHTLDLARVNNAIGVAHNFANDFERARQYYEEALRLARQVGNVSLECSVLGNLALSVSEIDGPEAGLPMHREALALAEARGDRHGVALQTGLICERLLQVGRLNEARATCLRALDHATELQISRPVAGLRMTLGDISWAEGNLSEAVEFYNSALQDAAGVVPSVALALHKKLSDTYEKLGDAESALRHLQRLMALRENLQERERQSLVEELEVKYEVEQRERQLELVTLDAALQEVELRQRTMLLLATAIGLAFACSGALIAWRGYRAKSKLERELDSRNQELEQAVEQIGRLARTDSLTGLWNRRAFEEMVTDELVRAKRSRQPLTIALGDIDHFKEINDRFGHQAGDEILRMLSIRLRAALRRTDSVCRWGGEEFMFLLTNNDTEAARRAMERVRRDLAENPLDVASEPVSITMTFGIARLTDDIDEAIRDADRAMYEGKRSGRDRIVVCGGSTT